MRLSLFLLLICVIYTGRAQSTIGQNQATNCNLANLFRQFSPENPDLGEDTLSINPKWLDGIGGFALTQEPPNINWVFEINNFYASRSSSSYFGDGLFSDIRLTNNVEIASIPFELSGNVVVQNNQINSRLSAITFSFDRQALVQRYNNNLNKNLLTTSFNALSDDQKNLLSNYSSVESYRQLRFSACYQLEKASLIQQIDSLINSMHTHSDSIRLDSLQDLRSKLEQKEHEVDSLHATILKQWGQLQKGASDLQKEWEKQKANALGGDLLKNENLNKLALSRWQRLLVNFEHFHIGSFRLGGNALDIASLPLHGIGFDFNRSGFYLSAAYGYEGRQRRQLPGYVQNFHFTGEGRRVLHMKAGIGDPQKNHFYIGMSDIRVPTPLHDSLGVFPKRSVVISADSRYNISEGFFVTCFMGISNSDFTGHSDIQKLLNELYAPDKRASNLAILAQVGWRSRSGQSEFLAGYQQVGSQYQSLGNMLLINNRQAIRLESRQTLFHKRCQLKMTALLGRPKEKGGVAIYPAVRENQFVGELSWRLDKRGSRAWTRYCPNTYLQQGEGGPLALYQVHLFNTGLQILLQAAPKELWSSSFQVTNYTDHSQFGDTSTVTGLWYSLLTQTYSARRYGFFASFNIGFDQNSRWNAKDINGEFSQSFILSKSFQLTQGIHLIRRYHDQNLLTGGSIAIQLSTKGHLRLALGGMYFSNLTTRHTHEYYLTSSASWQF